MPIPDNQITVAEIVVEGRIAASGVDTVQTINVFHYKRQTMSIPATKSGLDAAFDNNILDELQLCMNVRWTHVKTRVRWLNDAEDPYTDFAGGGLGQNAGDSMTSDKCVYMLLRTEKRGKIYRGAKFFGPLSEGDTTTLGDVLNAAAITRFTALKTAMYADILDANGVTWSPSLFTRKGSQIKTNPTTVITNRLSEVILNQRITGLKRRRTKSKY